MVNAADQQALMGNFELTCADGQVMTVAQLLDNPHPWHNTRFATSLDEPATVLSACLHQARPCCPAFGFDAPAAGG
jgi:hypothetical protein